MKLIQMADSKENNFTFLRFFAASLVILSHSFVLYGLEEPTLNGFATFGGMGVYIFFIVSGFLITKSWLNHPNILTYFRNRTLRIFPALIPAVLFTTFFIGPLVTTIDIKNYLTHPQTWEYMKNIFLFPIRFYLPGVFENNPYPNAVNGSLWTLPVEFFMYISVAIIGLTGLISKKVFVPLLISILIFLDWSLISMPEYNNLVILSFMPLVISLKLAIFFFVGSFFYLYRENILIDVKIAFAALFLLILLLNSNYIYILSYFILPYLIIFFAYYGNNFLKNFGTYGDFSYGLYIYAFPVQQTIIHFWNKQINLYIFMLAAFVITLSCAFISWKIIENPALEFKK